MKNLVRIIFWLLYISTASSVIADQSISNVGLRQFSVDFPRTNSEIKGLIWYPTLNASEKIKMGPFEVEVAKNATIENGKHGLVVISHGSQGSHLGHRDTGVYLAQRGYIVISPLHPKNNYLDDSAGRTVENWINRPLHISTVLDWVLNNREYKSYIDADRIAVIGFSAGGYTALSLVGGVPDTANIINHCSENKSDDSRFCGSSGLSYRILKLFSSQNVLENLHDHRIKAAVLLAPVGVLFKDKQSLANVQVPLRIYRAEKDTTLRYPYHAESIRKKLPMEPEFTLVQNAGHYSFLAPFPEKLKQEGGVVTKDPDGFSRTNFHNSMNNEIFEFLSRSLDN